MIQPKIKNNRPIAISIAIMIKIASNDIFLNFGFNSISIIAISLSIKIQKRVDSCKRLFPYLCPMTLEELEDYFHGIDLPKTIMLNKATKINSVAEFVKTTFMRAKGWRGDPNRNPSLWHLEMLHDILEKEGE